MNNLCQLSQSQLMDIINKTSFAVNDIQLYLDSHPDCPKGLAYFHEHNQLRNAALKEYSRRFGPLTLETASEGSKRHWEWIHGKWPWEGGRC